MSRHNEMWKECTEVALSLFHTLVPRPPTDVTVEAVIGSTSTSLIVSWTVSACISPPCKVFCMKRA